MPRKATLLNSLSRGRVRSSFNKYNLFNLYKKGRVDFRSKTLYQQKWTAKQELRAYHGEHLTERRWQSIFNPKLDSVAQLDASLKGGKEEETPFLLQTFASLEKRLDFAVFRAMFASSVRQARQFILQGNVFVNGIKIKHPVYTLKPGDVFRVKPSKVLEALGAKKPSLNESLKVDKIQVTLWNKHVKEARENPKAVWDKKLNKLREMDDSNANKQRFLEHVRKYNEGLEREELKALGSCTPTNMLIEILTAYSKSEKEPQSLIADDFSRIVNGDVKLSNLALECFREINKSKEFTREDLQNGKVDEIAHRLLAPTEEMKNKMSDGSKVSIRLAKKHLTELTKSLTSLLRKSFDQRKGDQNDISVPYDENWSHKLYYHPRINPKELVEDERKAQQYINLPWQKHLYGRANPKRPYFTPWKPRPFLAPFAILPHHLEISFKTCHAVYLRDPVARPGHSEVISPFDLPVHERAYMYYVRRGK